MLLFLGVGSLEEVIGDTAGGMEYCGDPKMIWGEAGIAQPPCIGGAEVYVTVDTGCLWKVFP